MASSSHNTRKETDVMNLRRSGFKVELYNDNVQEFNVYLNGPPDSPYAGGVWKLAVELPDDYPNSAPDVTFVTPIYHPNIRLRDGEICVNLLGEDWDPNSDLVNVFEGFLPLLLCEPNPNDPLNPDAAYLLIRDKSAYEALLREIVEEMVKRKDAGVVKDSGDKATTGGVGPVDP